MSSEVRPADVPWIDRRVMHIPGLLTPQECDRIRQRLWPEQKPCNPPRGIAGELHCRPIDDVADLCGVEDKMGEVAGFVNLQLRWGIQFDVFRAGCSRYDEGNWMGLHVDDEERSDDTSSWELPHRGVSMSVALSPRGTYEGGALRRMNELGELVPAWPGGVEQGDCIASGSSLPHDVAPVTAGSRSVLLGWLYTNHDMRGIE